MKRLRRSVVLCSIILIVVGFSGMGWARVAFNSYTEDALGYIVRTQDAYVPRAVVEKVGHIELRSPSDIFIDQRDYLYIADTDQGRIVVLTADFQLETLVGEGILRRPTGVYVDEWGNIYVADYGLSLVFKFAPSGEMLQSFARPQSPLFGQNSPYRPSKVVVDRRGNIYIIGDGTTAGIIQLSPYGDFLGYYGANEAHANLRLALQRQFFTKDQRERLFSNLPLSPTNLAIDHKGLIYTVTQGDRGASIKKLDISGANMLPRSMAYDPLFVDLWVGPLGNILALSQNGFIYEFDSEGNLIFIFGGKDSGRQRLGLFTNPSGIAVNSAQEIFVVDRERNNIQVFQRTEFTEEVHAALSLYNEGHYVQSQEPWRYVLRLNNSFDLAHTGIGHGYYKLEDYEQALASYEISNYKAGYSNAFWELRNRWLQEHLGTIIVVLILFAALKRLWTWRNPHRVFLPRTKGQLRKVSNYQLVGELRFLAYFLKNPADGYYGIKREGKTSNLSATILYLLFIGEYLASLYYTHFLFRSGSITDLSLSRELTKLGVPLLLWVISNYLVSTINDGEGTLSNVYQGTIYAFAPYLIFKPWVILVSNALTYNEAFIYDFSNTIIWVWTALLLMIMVMEIHNFSWQETLKNIFTTGFSMLILFLVVFIVYVLVDQILNFGTAVLQEVLIRVQS